MALQDILYMSVKKGFLAILFDVKPKGGNCVEENTIYFVCNGDHDGWTCRMCW
jgi:hypothetical protein